MAPNETDEAHVELADHHAWAARVRRIRLVALGLAVTFAVVGVLFFIIPDQVLEAVDWVGKRLGFPGSGLVSHSLYTVLAVAYMYMVVVLAWQTARRPRERVWPWLLVQAKSASAILSLALFAVEEQSFAYLANFLVDGAIAILVWRLCLRHPTAWVQSEDMGAGVSRRPLPRERQAMGTAHSEEQ